MKTQFVLFSFIILSLNIKAQNNNENNSLSSREAAVNLYLDCNSCDLTYFRQNFTLINYVRDRKVADVQVIVSTMRNGGGGKEYIMQFIGLGRFGHLKDTLKFNTKADATRDEIRKEQLKTLKLGLVPFILKTPYANKISVNYAQETVKAKENDPWNNWVFRISGNSWMNGQKNYNSTNVYTTVSASRITEDIKHETRVNLNFSENKYRLYNSKDSLIYSANTISRGVYFEHSTIWSMGEHWGAGVQVNAWQSTYSNIDAAYKIQPEIEYNLYKYSNASRKQLRFAYKIGANYRNYTDTTVYNKTEEYLAEQKFEINYKYITNWGSIRSAVNWQNYLHDFSLYSIGTSLSMNIRIFKGLSFNIYGNLQMPRNQISLVKTASTPEDVLLHQRELSTNYSYYTSIGIAYTFGSIYNNVVNPRLD
ncbi:MAG: hypothetical protein DSY76_06765 [Bacteroidetes bacterium]|nr:MAG: hypothetical protein DSY76_06765 [Bacteroidota bacterium]